MKNIHVPAPLSVPRWNGHVITRYCCSQVVLQTKKLRTFQMRLITSLDNIFEMFDASVVPLFKHVAEQSARNAAMSHKLYPCIHICLATLPGPPFFKRNGQEWCTWQLTERGMVSSLKTFLMQRTRKEMNWSPSRDAGQPASYWTIKSPPVTLEFRPIT